MEQSSHGRWDGGEDSDSLEGDVVTVNGCDLNKWEGVGKRVDPEWEESQGSSFDAFSSIDLRLK